MAQLQTVLAASDARANFYQILDEVSNNLRRFVIRRRNGTRAVVLPEEEVEAWEETLEILSNKKLMKDIRQSQKDFKSGKYYRLDEVEKEINKKSR